MYCPTCLSNISKVILLRQMRDVNLFGDTLELQSRRSEA